MRSEHENIIIGMLYEAAINPMLWQHVFAKIASYINCTTVFFASTDQLCPSQDFVFSYNIAQQSLDNYKNQKFNLMDMHLHAPKWDSKNLGDAVSFSYTPYQTMLGTDQYFFYEKCIKPTNVIYVCAILLDRELYSWAIFSVHRTLELGEFKTDDEQALKRIGIHMQRALKIYRKIHILKEEKNTIYHTLDVLQIGVMLIDDSYRLLFSNTKMKMIFEKTKILGLDNRSHLKTIKKFQDDLRLLIQNSFNSNYTQNQEIENILVLYDDSKNISLKLNIIPINDNFNNLQQRKIIIFVTEIETNYHLSKDSLIQKYKLSKREIEVCTLFINGMNLEQIAKEMNITYGTIRIYLKNIFLKTGTTSQAQLIKLLMNLTTELES